MKIHECCHRIYKYSSHFQKLFCIEFMILWFEIPMLLSRILPLLTCQLSLLPISVLVWCCMSLWMLITLNYHCYCSMLLPICIRDMQCWECKWRYEWWKWCKFSECKFNATNHLFCWFAFYFFISLVWLGTHARSILPFIDRRTCCVWIYCSCFNALVKFLVFNNYWLYLNTLPWLLFPYHL